MRDGLFGSITKYILNVLVGSIITNDILDVVWWVWMSGWFRHSGYGLCWFHHHEGFNHHEGHSGFITNDITFCVLVHNDGHSGCGLVEVGQDVVC